VHSSSQTREPGSMLAQEYDVLTELVRAVHPRHTLEIGLGSGQSAVEICKVLREVGGGRHLAIDPFQFSPDGHQGRGMQRIRREGFDDLLELIEDYDYLVLPRLLSEGRRFDFILIDGWHSFDYTLLDLFYADLLLRVGGVIAVHDTVWPAVHRACRFFETHKAYERIGPPILVRIDPLIGRAVRRVRQILAGPEGYAEAKSRRVRWCSLGAYRKLEDRIVPNDFYAAF